LQINHFTRNIANWRPIWATFGSPHLQHKC